MSLIAGFNQSKWGFSCEGLQLLDAKVLSVGCRWVQPCALADLRELGACRHVTRATCGPPGLKH